MSSENKISIAFAVLAPAAVEAGIVLLWIVMLGSPATAHFSWYVAPLIFFVVPTLALAVGAYLIKASVAGERSCLIVSLLWPLLGINLLALAIYLLGHSGGV